MQAGFKFRSGCPLCAAWLLLKIGHCAVQVGFVQTSVLGCLGCLWFNRNEVCISDCKISHFQYR